jgi:hypothetical protein
MNVLVLDPKTVCVEASEVPQQEQLHKLGFEIVPVPFRDAYPFGGALCIAPRRMFTAKVPVKTTSRNRWRDFKAKSCKLDSCRVFK